MGFFTFGPLMHRWYAMLDKRMKITKSLQTISKKVAADQGVFLPFFLVSFVGLNSCLREDSSTELRMTLRQEYWQMLRASYIVWIPAQFVNFSVIALTYRVLFCNVVGLGWNTYLAYQNK